jgi:hypothetical protein
VSDDWGNDALKQGTPPPEPDAGWGNDPVKGVPERTGFFGGLGERFMDTVYGTGQLMSHLDPGLFTSAEQTAQIDEAMRKREAENQRAHDMPAPKGTEPEATPAVQFDDYGRPIPKGPADRWRRTSSNPMADLGGLTAEVVNPLNYLAPEFDTLKLLGRVYTGAGQGAVSAATQPVTKKDGYWGDKTLQVGAGAGVGGAIPYLEHGAAELGRKLWAKVTGWNQSAPDKATDKAINLITRKYLQDTEGGGPSAQDMIDLRNTAPNKPWSLADVSGENVRGLIGKIQREPGAARQLITKWLDDRDLGAGLRLSKDVDASLGGQSEYQLFEGLKEARSIAAKPLFEKAYAGGSIAPLEAQLTKQEAEASTAIDKAVDALHSGSQVAGTDLTKLQGDLQQAIRDRDAIRQMRQQAQSDASANAPGAIWSPRLQQFLDNPRIQQGLAVGMKIERDTALAEGRAINPTEYAITGTNPQTGEDIVSKVPTMRRLAVAKEGLDRMLQSPEFKDPMTGALNKEGVAIDRMRNAYLEELDKLNPDYKVARAQWGGDTQSMAALKFGEEFPRGMKAEAIRDQIEKMPAGDREFARLGLAARLRREVSTTGAQGNEARSIAKNQLVREQIRPFFESDAEFDKFIDSINAEGKFFDTRHAIKGGSITAGRLANDTAPVDAGDLGHAAMAGQAASHGNPALALYHAAKIDRVAKLLGLQEKDIPEDVKTEIANIVSDPQRSLQVMGGLQTAKPKRDLLAGRRPLLSGIAAQSTANQLGVP